MAPFNKHEHAGNHSFWDYYRIGGRWAGQHMLSHYPAERIDAFSNWLTEQNVTDSGFMAGNQELMPEDQIPKVDAKWNEMFPQSNGKFIPCPLFKHGGDAIDLDVCRLGEIGPELTCARFIVAGPGWKNRQEGCTGSMEAKFMMSDEIWNGINYEQTIWDGSINHGIKLMTEEPYIKGALFGLEAENFEFLPDDFWIATIDYHS
jgi:hypothetical protein